METLIAEGVLAEVRAKLSYGKTHSLVVHRDNLPLLEQAGDGALPAGRTTFLNPFDNLFANELVIGRSEPAVFGEELVRTL